jgi:hypothetical protein
MRNTADVTGGKPIAILLQSISGVSASVYLVSFSRLLGHLWRKERGDILLFYLILILLKDTLLTV